MKKRLLTIVLFITMSLFIMPTMVKAEGTTGRPTTAVLVEEVLGKETTLYVGEVIVDGESNMQYLYSSDLKQSTIVYDNFREALPARFASLLPTTVEVEGEGLAVSSSNQSEMNGNWTSSAYVANQYYPETAGTETTSNLYDVDADFKNYVDVKEAARRIDFADAMAANKRVFSITNTKTEGNWVMVDGGLQRQDTITFTYEATTVIYTKVEIGNASSAKQITGANITLKKPLIGDKIEKVKKTSDGYEYETQSAYPTVSTNTEGLTISAYWVQGLEDLAEESFYGTFEEGKYYYALIDFEAEEGYELPSTFPDGITINGESPAEVFAVMMGKWNHCIVKVQAVSEEEQKQTEETSKNIEEKPTSHKFLEGEKGTYTPGKDETLKFRIDADFSLFDNGGLVYVDNKEVDSKYYAKESGSTVITLKKEYLDSLSTGSHTMKVVFNDGSTSETTFTVSEKINNPKTADNLTHNIIMLGVCITGLISSTIFLKKKQYN